MLNPKNPTRWLNSPFHVSEPSNNDLVFIVDNSGVVLTEILPGAIRGVRDTNPDKSVKLKLAEVIVECLNTVLGHRQERTNSETSGAPVALPLPVEPLGDWGLVPSLAWNNKTHSGVDPQDSKALGTKSNNPD